MREPSKTISRTRADDGVPALIPSQDNGTVHTLSGHSSEVLPYVVLGTDDARPDAFVERCRQFCLSVFFDEHRPVRSLGFTSSVAGEGKTFLATLSAGLLARDASTPVTLLECNWMSPSVHTYFGVPPEPGLAEWIRGSAHEDAIRRQVSDNLNVVPAGTGGDDAVKLIDALRHERIPYLLNRTSELLILDLPPVLSCGYGSLAASLAEALVIVVRAGVTPAVMIADTCKQLKDLPVRGIALNQVESRVPKWLRRVL